MSARDRYQMPIECQNCGSIGEAKVSESDGWSFKKGNRDRSVDQVSMGFAVVDHGTNKGETTTFRCDCGTLIELT